MKAADETITKVGGSTVEHTYQYTYDMRSQLLGALRTDVGTEDWDYDQYSYDKPGNIQNHRHCTNVPSYTCTYTDYAFGNDDLMDTASSTTGGENFTLDWDDNGNLTAKDDTADTTLTYNWDNRLRAGAMGPNTISLKYDPLGNRVLKASSVTGTRKYIVDIAGALPTILLELDPCNGMEVKKTYIYANSQILAQHDGDYAAPIYFYLHDRLGSVRMVVATDGTVKNHYSYDPFGKILTAETAETTENPFKFTGQWYDAEIGEYYLRARMYDPQLMRFTGRDPVAGKFEEPLSLHAYLYCRNNPTNSADPSGLVTVALYAAGDLSALQAANDFDWAVPITSMESAASMLEAINLIEDDGIEGAWVFDHGYPSYTNSGVRQRFGADDEWLWLSDPGCRLKWMRMAAAVQTGGYIHLRGCSVAEGDVGRQYISELAKLGNRFVTGYEGLMYYGHKERWGPDYWVEPGGSLWVASPTGSTYCMGVGDYFHPDLRSVSLIADPAMPPR